MWKCLNVPNCLSFLSWNHICSKLHSYILRYVSVFLRNVLRHSLLYTHAHHRHRPHIHHFLFLSRAWLENLKIKKRTQRKSFATLPDFRFYAPIMFTNTNPCDECNVGPRRSNIKKNRYLMLLSIIMLHKKCWKKSEGKNVSRNNPQMGAVALTSLCSHSIANC